MRVPVTLSEAFGPESEFEDLLAGFAGNRGLLPSAEELRSSRFLSRSILPHLEKLSAMFNRTDSRTESSTRSPTRAAEGITARYWGSGSNPANLRLAYLLAFMPPNLFRVASIWSELSRLGYRWPAGSALRAIEVGAGPASGACGIAAGERHAPLGLPNQGSWALLEQDGAILELGAAWAAWYFERGGTPLDWSARPFKRKLDFSKPLLPPTAPSFNLWVFSYVLNEASESPAELASALLDTWSRHLDEEGIIVIAEPALKLQSRKLLALRKALLDAPAFHKLGLQILLPCLGHQACGALAEEDDWCHEETTWWRPPYLRKLDEMAKLDRKSLPFSYLVLARSRRSRSELLPATGRASRLHRLVSPAHSEGRDAEFFICGADGKRRARLKNAPDGIGRGDILKDADLRGDARASRIDSIQSVL